MRRSSESGFTLVELMTVVGIMIIMLGVMLTGGSGSRETARVTSEAYELAVMYREAQQNSLTVRPDPSGSFDNGYGVRVSGGADTASMFVDGNTPHQFDSGLDVEIEVHQLNHGVTVAQICTLDTNYVETCQSTGSLDVTFLRPDQDAHFSLGGSSNFAGVRVYLGSSRIAFQRPIEILNTGQISVLDAVIGGTPSSPSPSPTPAPWWCSFLPFLPGCP